MYLPEEVRKELARAKAHLKAGALLEPKLTAIVRQFLPSDSELKLCKSCLEELRCSLNFSHAPP